MPNHSEGLLWPRYDAYEVVRDPQGVACVVPRPGGRVDVYRPLVGLSRSGASRLAGNEPVYQALARLVLELQGHTAWDDEYYELIADPPVDEVGVGRLLDWCRQYGLLGLLPEHTITIVGESSAVADTYSAERVHIGHPVAYRTVGRWVEEDVFTPSREYVHVGRRWTERMIDSGQLKRGPRGHSYQGRVPERELKKLVAKGCPVLAPMAVVQDEVLWAILSSWEWMISRAERRYVPVSLENRVWADFFPQLRRPGDLCRVVSSDGPYGFGVDIEVGGLWLHYGEPIHSFLTVASLVLDEMRTIIRRGLPQLRFRSPMDGPHGGLLLSLAAASAPALYGSGSMSGTEHRRPATLLGAVAVGFLHDYRHRHVYLCDRCQVPCAASASHARWCSRCAESGRKGQQRAKKRPTN